MKTYMAKDGEVKRAWHIVDASGMRVGRLATQLATVLRGKDKPQFTPHTDCGDFVVVINTNKLELSGDKWQSKKFYRHSRFFGSLKEKTAAQMTEEDPSFVLREAVRGMLPTNKLSRRILLKLKTFPGAEHDHASQNPVALTPSEKK